MCKMLNILWKILWVCWIWFLTYFLLSVVLCICYLCPSCLEHNLLVTCSTWSWTSCKVYLSFCLTNQSCPKNISILFRSVTTTLIHSLCSLILTLSGAILVTFLFLVSSALNILKEKSTGFVYILLSLTNCSLIPI